MKNRPADSDIVAFRLSVVDELENHILPFWRNHAVDERGGFIGRITHDMKREPGAPKGLILNARILWTFASAYGFDKDERNRSVAQRAFEYLDDHFWDERDGGYFWMVSPDGTPLDDKKKIYGQAFGIYGLTEYHRQTSSNAALDRAKLLFELVETNGRDVEYGGYFETYNRDWTLADDLRLSDVDLNEKKSMNTHLHLLEAYASLFKTWKDPLLEKRLEELIRIHLERIIDPGTGHLNLFFDETWTPKCDHISFGHDIETSWLLLEAAEALGAEALIDQSKETAVRMSEAVLKQGIAPDGGLIYEADPGGLTDLSKDWWPQAEAVVGFLNAFQINGDKAYWKAANSSWEFILNTVIDHKNGEWFWKIREDGKPDPSLPKLSEWKCPYHNARMCLEASHRLDVIQDANR